MHKSSSILTQGLFRCQLVSCLLNKTLLQREAYLDLQLITTQYIGHQQHLSIIVDIKPGSSYKARIGNLSDNDFQLKGPLEVTDF